MSTKLDIEARKIGLHISEQKTKTMSIGSHGSSVPIIIQNQQVEEVERFTYLGSIISKDGEVMADVSYRIGKASAVFQKLRQVWKSTNIDTSLKLQLYETIVIPTAIYACETWKITAKIAQKLNVFHSRCLRRILKIRYSDHITNEEVLLRSHSKRLQDVVMERRLRLAGHILRLPNQRHSKSALRWTPRDGRRKVGRPRKTWRRTLQEDLQVLGIKWCDMEEAASDRILWRRLVAQCALLHGRS